MVLARNTLRGSNYEDKIQTTDLRNTLRDHGLDAIRNGLQGQVHDFKQKRFSGYILL